MEENTKKESIKIDEEVKEETKEAAKEDTKEASKEAAKTSDKNEEAFDEAAAAMKKNNDTSDEGLEEISLDKKGKSEDKAAEAAKVVQKKKLTRKTKKIIRVVIVIAIIFLAIYIALQYAGFKAQALLSSFTSDVSYDEVSRMDLAQTISTTGTIQSKDVRTITSALSGVTIEEVNYEVGDMVEEGAVLVSFSVEDINKKIENLQSDINEARASQSLDAVNRDTNYNYNYGTEAYNLSNAGTRTAQAQQDLQTAYNDLSEAQQRKSDFVSKYETALANKDGVNSELETVKRLYSTWQRAVSIPNVTPAEYIEEWASQEEKLDWNNIQLYYNYLQTKDSWEDYISSLQTLYNEYESTIKNYDSQITSYNNAIENAEKGVTNAQRAADSAVTSQNEQIRNSTNNMQRYDYNYAKERLTAGDTVENYERQMEEYIDRLDEYIVYAPITGMVTSVNAQEGNGYQATSGALMTIQAVDSYEVSTQIDEYDIPNVEEGQKAVIMTDATGDEELEGVVSFVSPTATAGQSGNTYEVKINILTKNDRIKLGMSAKLNIIVEEHSNVLAVRYDALEQKANGDYVIYTVDSDPTKKDEGSQNAGDGILVVGTDGSQTVTGTPKGDKKPQNFGKDRGKSDEKEQSFLAYLFSSKKDKEDAVDSATPTSAAKEIVVNVGIEGDYYTEISAPEVKEGMVVTVKSNSNNNNNPFEAFMMPDYGDGPGMGY